MPSAQVNGISLYYEVHGAGRPLLLIGGLSSDITLFGQMMEVLAQGHQVIAFDNRGAGRTDKPDAPYTIAMMAQDAVALLDELAVGRADVLGISMGGRIAIEIALSRPDRVDHLLLISTSAAGRGKIRLSWPMRLVRLLAWVGLLRRKYPQPRYAYRRQREASVSYDAAGRLGEISVPTWIAHGRRDRTVPLEAAEQMHAGIAGSHLEVFNGGHMFFLLSERRRLIDEVETFLASPVQAGAQHVATAQDAATQDAEHAATSRTVRIAGPRLVLRALRPAEIDAEWQAMLTADPIATTGPLDEASFRARLERSGVMVDGWIDLAIDLDGTSIGRIQTFVPPDRPLPPGTFDVGIGLREQARGKGYGREAVQLLTDWLFESAHARVIEAGTDHANRAMRTVFERVGWAEAGTLFEVGHEWVMYRITRDQWQAQRTRSER